MPVYCGKTDFSFNRLVEVHSEVLYNKHVAEFLFLLNGQEGGEYHLKADTITKDYVSDTEVFADVFNYYIYGGQQMISPEQLAERDPTEISLPYGARGAVAPVQKFRDVQKLCTAMTDGELEYVVYGVEAQSNIHNAMAVRNNLYDALEYAGQVREADKSHRKEMKKAKEKKRKTGDDFSGEEKSTPSKEEFLSGFWGEDRLVPSVTVTLYFGADEWTAPTSLHEMMEVKDSRVLACINNYKLHLIAPAHLTDGEIVKFKSSLREVMLFIKYSKDRTNLQRVLKENEERFREVERRAVDVIEAITHTGLKYKEEEANIDMCQAIEEMKMEAERDGEERGQRIGEKNGELKKAKEAARNFYHLGIEVEKIAEGLGYAVDTVKGWLGLPADARRN